MKTKKSNTALVEIKSRALNPKLVCAALLVALNLVARSLVAAIQIEDARIESFDRQRMEVRLEGSTEKYAVTSETRFYENGQPVTTGALKTGCVFSAYVKREADGRQALVRVFLAPPPQEWVPLGTGVVASFDRECMELKLAGREAVYLVTRQTRFHEAGETVTSDALLPGTIVSGLAERQTDGQLHLLHVFLGSPEGTSMVQK